MSSLKPANIIASMEWSGIPFDELRRSLLASGHAYEGRSPWLQARFGDPSFYIAFYRGGRFLTTGGKSLLEARRRLDLAGQTASRAGPGFQWEHFRIDNLVLTGQLPLRIGLEKLIGRIPPTYDASYEPEQFPALQIAHGPVTFLLYRNGRFVLTGVKSDAQAQEAFARLSSDLGALGAL